MKHKIEKRLKLNKSTIASLNGKALGIMFGGRPASDEGECNGDTYNFTCYSNCYTGCDTCTCPQCDTVDPSCTGGTSGQALNCTG